MKLKTILLALSVLVSIAHADDITNKFSPKTVDNAQIKQYFNKLLPTTTISKIYSTPYPDTYALIIGSNILYGNTHSNYLTAGHMFNVYTQDDITADLQQINAPKIDISKFNLSDALVYKSPNNVNKKLIVFVDPDCPYCRQLEKQIEDQQLYKKADIYYMLMPLPMHPNAKAHTTNILCLKAPIDTLKEYMLNNNDNPKVSLNKDCNIDSVMERVGSVARSLNINGTPAIVTGKGDLIMGDDINAINNYLSSK